MCFTSVYISKKVIKSFEVRCAQGTRMFKDFFDNRCASFVCLSFNDMCEG